MSSGNKRAKQRLIELYGAECFIDKLKLRKFEKPVHYTSKGQRKRMEMLTYHHIQMKSKGGKATVENGALLSARNHQWFHQQPQKAQDRMNEIFQEYKRREDERRYAEYDRCMLELTDDLPEEPFDLDLIEIEVKDRVQARKYKRAKEKEKIKELMDEYYDREI